MTQMSDESLEKLSNLYEHIQRNIYDGLCGLYKEGLIKAKPAGEQCVFIMAPILFSSLIGWLDEDRNLHQLIINLSNFQDINNLEAHIRYAKKKVAQERMEADPEYAEYKRLCDKFRDEEKWYTHG